MQTTMKFTSNLTRRSYRPVEASRYLRFQARNMKTLCKNREREAEKLNREKNLRSCLLIPTFDNTILMYWIQ